MGWKAKEEEKTDFREGYDEDFMPRVVLFTIILSVNVTWGYVLKHCLRDLMTSRQCQPLDSSRSLLTNYSALNSQVAQKTQIDLI
ncbi:hypothetical protein CB1_001679009 [Camelus ferus]|nr:hypothetical protein CB1_001679009 [Camelus ferus]